MKRRFSFSAMENANQSTDCSSRLKDGIGGNM